MLDDNQQPLSPSPHLLALVNLFDDHLKVHFNQVIDWAFGWLFGHPPKLLDVSDTTGDFYRETDSIIGVINHSRRDAANLMAMYNRFSSTEKKQSPGTVDEAEYQYRLSCYMARKIGDLPGTIKALKGLSLTASHKGLAKLASGRTALAKHYLRQLVEADKQLANYYETHFCNPHSDEFE